MSYLMRFTVCTHLLLRSDLLLHAIDLGVHLHSSIIS